MNFKNFISFFVVRMRNNIFSNSDHISVFLVIFVVALKILFLCIQSEQL